MTIVGSPIKLRSGRWGAKVVGHVPEVGSVITIRTKAGKTWTAVVKRVLWAENGVAIVDLIEKTRPSRRSRRYPVSCEECGEIIRTPGQICWETGLKCVPERR